jgi:hypothetical protein
MPLPKFDGLGVKTNFNGPKDKKVLVCFFDYEQRPSRHMIRALASRAIELKEKGVGVVAVQASKVDREELDDCVKKYNVTFPVGMIEGDEEQIRFNWGVKSLPWLIWTDGEHIVQAEGFGLEELEELLRAARVEKNALGRLSLSVVDEDDNPLDITSVQIWNENPSAGAQADSFAVRSSDRPGFYEINGIPVGRYGTLSIQLDGFAPFWKYDVIVEKNSKDLLVCQLYKGGTISGYVTDEQGHPVKGVPVVVNSILCRRDVTTDEKGRFVANHLPDTHYSVIAEPGPNSPYRAKVLKGGAKCGAKDLHIAVEREKEAEGGLSLAGKSIWHVNELPVFLDPTQSRGKRILLCFWDMNQRPSRRMIRELAKRAKELKEKGVSVVAVQASKVEKEILDEWLKENDVPFSVGMIEKDEEKVRFNWGVKSLPWLILTDQKHIVWAEGFSINELDEKITKLTEK